MVAVVAAAACEPPRLAPVASVDTIGDTIVSRSRGSVSVIRLDSVETLWRSPEIENPRRMMFRDGVLYVAELARLNRIDVTTRDVRSVGRSGEGPGEFRLIMLLGAFHGDSIAVYDLGLRAMSVFDAELRYGRRFRMSPLVPYVDMRSPRDFFQKFAGGYLTYASTNAYTDRPTRAALVWHDIEVDTAAVLRVLDHYHFISPPGSPIMGPKSMFPRSMHVAVSGRGEFVYGDGMEYCVTIEQVLPDATLAAEVERVCRDVPPLAVGPGIRNASFEGRWNEAEQERFQAMQEIPEYMPFFDALKFGTDDRLWVRRIDPAMAEIHPVLLETSPDRPSHRTWDVFGRDRSLVASVAFPWAFTPFVFTEEEAFGTLELPSGELVIARARFGG